MKVVGHERPGKAFGAGCGEEFGEAFQEEAPIIVIEKNIPPFDSADDNVL
jgi:hypothetical protein